MYYLIMFLFATASTQVLASGGVSCKATGPTKFEISWGVTHGIGSPRIGPYRIALKDKNYLIWPYGTTKSKSSEKSIQDVEANEVGYWNEGSQIQVRLTDSQILWTLLLLDVRVEGKKGIVGEAAVQLQEKGFAKKFPLVCDVE